MVIDGRPYSNDSWLCMVSILPKPNHVWCLLYFFLFDFMPSTGWVLRHYLPIDHFLSTFSINVGTFVVCWYFSRMFLAFPYFSLLIFFIISDHFFIFARALLQLLLCSLVPCLYEFVILFWFHFICLLTLLLTYLPGNRFSVLCLADRHFFHLRQL